MRAAVGFAAHSGWWNRKRRWLGYWDSGDCEQRPTEQQGAGTGSIRGGELLRCACVCEGCHTAATLMLRAGVPVHIVAARLGDDPRTVLGIYAHLLPSSDEVAAERVAALLD